MRTKESVGQPTGSTIEVALQTDLEIKLKVVEGETSKTEGGFTKESVGCTASVLEEETSGQRPGGKDTAWVDRKSARTPLRKITEQNDLTQQTEKRRDHRARLEHRQGGAVTEREMIKKSSSRGATREIHIFPSQSK